MLGIIRKSWVLILWGWDLVLLHILPPRIPKQLRRPRRIRHPPRHLHHLPRCPSRVLPILEKRLQAPRKHLLKPHHHHAICDPMRHSIPRHMQACGASRAVVIDVVDGNAGHAELVKHPLAAGTVAVTVACDTLLDVVIINTSVEEGFDAGFEAELGVIDLSAGFDELGHADTEDVGLEFGRFAHGDGSKEQCGDRLLESYWKLQRL